MPSRRKGESAAAYRARNARYYVNRVTKGAKAGKSLQESRGAHPREKKATHFRPGPVARTIYGEPAVRNYVTTHTHTTYGTRGGASTSNSIVFPLHIKADWARVRRYVRELPQSFIDEERLVYRFGGQFARYEADKDHQYGTTSFAYYYDWRSFMLEYADAQRIMLDGLVDNVRFSIFPPVYAAPTREVHALSEQSKKIFADWAAKRKGR